MAEGFLGFCVSSLSRRGLLLVIMNLLFFGSIFVVALLTDVLYPPLLYEGTVHRESSVVFPWLESFLVLKDLALLTLCIFLFNLVASAIIVVTLPGMLFFGLPVGVLLVRGMIWGSLLGRLLTSQLLVILPTVVLEGEAYVLASVAGINLGLSWLKPSWVFGDEWFSRSEAFGDAFAEGVCIYVFVAIILLVAAVVEAFTLIYVM